METDFSNRLSRHELFSGLDLDSLLKIASISDYLDLSDGDILIEEQGSGHDLYLLLSGNVEIVSSDTPVTSDEVVLSSDDKSLLGEIAWLTGGKHTASVRCHGRVEAIRIDGAELKKFLDMSPDIGAGIYKKIAGLLADRLTSTDDLLKQILWNSRL